MKQRACCLSFKETKGINESVGDVIGVQKDTVQTEEGRMGVGGWSYRSVGWGAVGDGSLTGTSLGTGQRQGKKR